MENLLEISCQFYEKHLKKCSKKCLVVFTLLIFRVVLASENISVAIFFWRSRNFGDFLESHRVKAAQYPDSMRKIEKRRSISQLCFYEV